MGYAARNPAISGHRLWTSDLHPPHPLVGLGTQGVVWSLRIDQGAHSIGHQKTTPEQQPSRLREAGANIQRLARMLTKDARGPTSRPLHSSDQVPQWTAPIERPIPGKPSAPQPDSDPLTKRSVLIPHTSKHADISPHPCHIQSTAHIKTMQQQLRQRPTS